MNVEQMRANLITLFSDQLKIQELPPLTEETDMPYLNERIRELIKKIREMS